ncbi:MAG: hypothetical protein KatS3mg115_0102 [Candidatus Poribacteria bacterium]|nr:MAG: hypothetical protein KatS3mg115_0102 [Candidatus Poribacteria bacterium]
MDRLRLLTMLLATLTLGGGLVQAQQQTVEWIPTGDETIRLRLVVQNLREATRPDGKPVLTFDGGRIRVAPEVASPFAVVIVPIGLPPESQPTLVLRDVQEERVPLDRFPDLLASDWKLEETQEPIASVEPIGYLRDRYIGRVIFRPLRVEGNELQIVRSCTVEVRPSVPLRAPDPYAVPYPPSAFDELAGSFLANAPQSASWRAGRRPVFSAAAFPRPRAVRSR